MGHLPHKVVGSPFAKSETRNQFMPPNRCISCRNQTTHVRAAWNSEPAYDFIRRRLPAGVPIISAELIRTEQADIFNLIMENRIGISVFALPFGIECLNVTHMEGTKITKSNSVYLPHAVPYSSISSFGAKSIDSLIMLIGQGQSNIISMHGAGISIVLEVHKHTLHSLGVVGVEKCHLLRLAP